ncbi:hypothetical protein EDD16DRAFT_983089 [Pisolithus croceorrhizus]|nr:hypothetical protein F5141DRAFT_234168 [Pisolithus sp. B1]KAI6118490.1 hypothetical protein EDD16DRAFT_983089 [Pisolithus croceorrhizus]KAI6135435.1 hypothetical protein EV401DRAFT_534440 [Pisolithus croceorrhizus]KAI6159015.1 hypothetical protein EDD17DRAFT_934904 [Pisolithus thermaeus]
MFTFGGSERWLCIWLCAWQDFLEARRILASAIWRPCCRFFHVSRRSCLPSPTFVTVQRQGLPFEFRRWPKPCFRR